MLKELTFLALVGFAIGQGIVDSRCIQPNTRPAQRLPHETNCSLYYVCHFGERLLMPACPTGMQFDTPSLSCRAPPVTCGPAAETTTAPPTTVAETTAATTTAATTTAAETTAAETTAAETTAAETTAAETTAAASTAPVEVPTLPNEIPTVGPETTAA